jgi:hypothetical protein
MTNMNIFFEHMPIILKNHMFKVNLNKFLKNANTIFLFFRLPKETK